MEIMKTQQNKGILNKGETDAGICRTLFCQNAVLFTFKLLYLPGKK
jgi:hypothetical protein